jgi:hypothetical protein
VSYRGTRIEGNLTAAQIAIWNAGREPIKREDILMPITLRTADTCRIFDVIMSKTNAADEFKVKLAGTDMATGKLGMDWKILERNEGALIQIVYAGAPEASITLDGRVIGQTEPRQKKRSIPPNSLILLLCMFLGLSTIDKISEMVRPSKSKILRIAVLTFLAICLVSIFCGLWFLWPFQSNKTPFGF